MLPGEVCCYDNTEDRVTIGIGDGCCGTVPFSSTGAQTCCDGLYIPYLPYVFGQTGLSKQCRQLQGVPTRYVLVQK